MRPSFHILVNTSNWVSYILDNLVGKVLGSAFWLFISWALVGAPTSRQRWTFVISGTAKCRCRYASMNFILYLFEASSSHSCSFRVWLTSKPSWEIGPRLSAFSFIITANWKFKCVHNAALSCQCSRASTISPILFSLDSELAMDTFFLCFALDVTANCICEIHWIGHDGFDINTVNKLSCLAIKY